MSARSHARGGAPRELQRELAAVLDSAMDAILMAGHDGQIVLINPAAERVFGCCASEAVGKPLASFIGQEIGGGDTVSSEHHQDGAAESTFMTSHRVVAHRPDGGTFLADAVICRIEHGGQTESIVTVRDLSDQRDADRMLRKLSSAVARTADAVYITDRNGVIEYVNPAFLATMGLTSEAVIGHKPNIFKSGRHDRTFYERLWSTLLAGQVYQGVLVDRANDGRIIHLDQTITPLRDDAGEVTHFVAVGRDITPRIETEAALRRLNLNLERQARQIAEALHDEAGQVLISAFIALSRAKRAVPADAHAHLRTVKQHLEGVEEQLRRIAHELRPRILEDMGLVPALKFLADGLIARSGVAVSVDSNLVTRLPPLLEATIYRFAQETLSNARRHASASHVTLRVEHCRRRLRCTVTDDGVGFSSTPKASGEEPGMGLQSIRDRIAALGGTFEIRSAAGRGTEITIAIPLEE